MDAVASRAEVVVGATPRDIVVRYNKLRVYHYPTRTLSLRLQFEKEFGASYVRFTPDGRKLVAVDGTGMLRCWNFAGAKK